MVTRSPRIGPKRYNNGPYPKQITLERNGSPLRRVYLPPQGYLRDYPGANRETKFLDH